MTGYLNSSVKLPDSKYYNSSNRAYPDVSAMSDDFWIIIYRFVAILYYFWVFCHNLFTGTCLNPGILVVKVKMPLILASLRN